MKTTVTAIGSGTDFEAMMTATGVTSSDVECSDDDTGAPDTFNFVFVIDKDKIPLAQIYLQDLQEI